ncbi:hypothetical protein [Schleiferilactobacillus shenzhenensis]|uniref:Uncharacterized protein n=1 Tax=Schleiferilactobacillus shenzhenensis LY-73 TaxID=1231336 RepID=U4TXZ3_9LACO|nr:hypothetical protein [Schleiferilactobacillus shenzhenensis]ERL66683.1 hypothetical protein L248_0362 [Schleiferilactobacillus shenzhenensis LY-73]
MTDNTLAAFPQGEFAAFSTAQMAHFLPYRAGMSQQAIEEFFGADLGTKADFDSTHLIVFDHGRMLKVNPGEIVVKFPNGKYKVITVDYYNKNFNEPIVVDDDPGVDRKQAAPSE